MGLLSSNRQRVRAASPSNRTSLRLECLEDRCLLSTYVTESPPLPTPSSSPYGVTTGIDLNMWYTDPGANIVGRRNHDGSVTTFSIPTANSQPGQIIQGFGPNLWFVETAGNKIARISPTGVITEFALPTANSQPVGITRGLDGNFWFTEKGSNKIGRISPQGVLTEFGVPTANAGLTGITADWAGNVWFTEANADKIGRITYWGTVTEFALPTANADPTRITFGPDGRLWFTETNANQIGRMGLGGQVTEFAIPTANANPQDIVAGQDGRLWFTEGAGKIGCMTTTGFVDSELYLPAAGASPAMIAIGPHGTLWFTQPNVNRLGTVHQVLSSQQQYLEDLVEDILGRLARQIDFYYWQNLLQAGYFRVIIAQMEDSLEAFTHRVDEWFETYLGRQADPAGEQYFVGLLERGFSDEQALSVMLGSDEFLYRFTQQHGPSANPDFIRAVYQEMLGRPAGDNDLKYWESRLALVSRAEMVLEIALSAEFRTLMVLDFFTDLFHRTGPVNPYGVQYFVGSQMSLETIRMEFELAPEFVNDNV